MTRRLGLALLCASLLAPGLASAADTPAKTEPTKPTETADKPTKAKVKSTTKAKGATKKEKTKAEPVETAAAKRRRIGANPAYVVGDSNAHFINEQAPKIVAFPQDMKAVDKAFSETRRDQLVDADKAARAAKSPDRWRTVLFSLRGLNERSDPEACFWRVLSFYRLGEIERARAVREGCELPGKDSSVLNAEDATATGIPVVGTVARDDGFGPVAGAAGATGAQKPKAPAVIEAPPYAGPGPQRFQ